MVFSDILDVEFGKKDMNQQNSKGMKCTIVSGITFNPNNDRWKKEIISCISLLKTRKPSQKPCNRILFRFHLCHITMPKPVTGKKINTTLDQLVTVVSDSLQSPRLWPTGLFCPWGFQTQEY